MPDLLPIVFMGEYGYTYIESKGEIFPPLSTIQKMQTTPFCDLFSKTKK